MDQQEIMDFIQREGLRGKPGKNPDDYIFDACPNCGQDKAHINLREGYWYCPHKSCSEGKRGSGSFKRLREVVTGSLVAVRAPVYSPAPPKAINECLAFHQALLADEEGMAYLKSRGLTRETIEHFKVGFTMQWYQKTERREKFFTFPHIQGNKLVNVIFRNYPPIKDFHQIKGAAKSLFNEDDLVGKRKVFLTEGHFDAMTLWQHGIGRDPDSGVGSLPQGADTCFKPDWMPALLAAEEINLVYDNDEKGQAAAQKSSEAFGLKRCYTIKLSKKDANAFFNSPPDGLASSRRAEFDLAYAQAREVEGMRALETVLRGWSRGQPRKVGRYLQTKWPCINTIWEGAPAGCFIRIQAAERVGKTNFAYNLLYPWAVEQHIPVAIFPTENDIERVALRLVSMDLAKSDKAITDEDIETCLHMSFKNVPFYVVDRKVLYGPSLESVCHLVRRAQARYGIQVFCMDHIQALRRRDNVEEDNHIMRVIRSLCNETGIRFILIAHTRKIHKGDIPDARDGSGSAQLVAQTDTNFTLHRNKIVTKSADIDERYGEDDIYEPLTYIEISGKYGCGKRVLNFDKETGLFEMIEERT